MGNWRQRKVGRPYSPMPMPCVSRMTAWDTRLGTNSSMYSHQTDPNLPSVASQQLRTLPFQKKSELGLLGAAAIPQGVPVIATEENMMVRAPPRRLMMLSRSAAGNGGKKTERQKAAIKQRNVASVPANAYRITRAQQREREALALGGGKIRIKKKP